MKHKCDGCRYKGEHQEMGFRPIGICTQAISLEYATRAYNAPECPYKFEDIAEIVRLADKLHQAVEDIRMLGRTGEFICPVCAHYNHGEGTKGECIKCLTGDGFEWRGSHERQAAD